MSPCPDCGRQPGDEPACQFCGWVQSQPVPKGNADVSDVERTRAYLAEKRKERHG